MFNKLKNLVRDLLPKNYQVPVKYFYGSLRGTLEDEMKLLKFLVRSHDHVIDIGGNRGIYAYQLWKLGTKVEVFEPNPTCARILSAWAVDKPTVNVHTVALSSHVGSANLHIPIDESGIEHDASASIENTGFLHARDQLVPLQTLDSYQFEDVSLIKIDVEGHEYSVIEGAEATIISSRPALLVEIEQRHNSRPIGEVFEKIIVFGYEGYFMMKGKLMPLKNFNVASNQSMEDFNNSTGVYINNFLFLHQSRLAEGEYGNLISNGLLN